jgi:hypothetical protein
MSPLERNIGTDETVTSLKDDSAEQRALSQEAEQVAMKLARLQAKEENLPSRHHLMERMADIYAKIKAALGTA